MFTMQFKVPYTELVENRARELQLDGYAVVFERSKVNDDWVRVWMTNDEELASFARVVKVELGPSLLETTPITQDDNQEVVDRALEVLNITAKRLASQPVYL
jgi:hypothetical protein